MYRLLVAIAAAVALVCCAVAANTSASSSPSKDPAPASSHATPGAAASGVSSGHGSNHGSKFTTTAAEALNELREGNARFLAGDARHPAQDPQRRAKLASGQAPHAIVLSCSDSRVPPEIVFDRGLGEIFVVRVAGNILGNAAVASMEYAVEHLGCPLIVVMGHESCGAVKAAMTTEPDEAGSLDLYALLSAIRPNIAGAMADGATDPTITGPVKANVDAVVSQLVARSRIVRERMEEGLLVFPAIYRLDSGAVEFWGAAETSIARRPKAH